jgi:O-methyltransferase
MEIRHPLGEILYRVSDPEWVVSHAFRQATTAYDLVSPSDFSKLYRQVRNITMCSNARLRGLHRAIRHVVAHGVPGDVVECGTARGGSAALMGLTLKQLGATERTLWVFDTFEGIPAPTPEDPDHKIAELYTGACVGSIEEVTASFRQLEILPKAKLVKGLFDQTLRLANIGPIAVLHIDGDWYASVKTCLETLYDKVVDGGVIQFDDYGYWKGARKAVDEFLANRSISPRLKRVDYSGRQLIKSSVSRFA